MKETVAYLTRHHISNYGSVLQAFATQRVLEKLGYQPLCIDYYRRDEQPDRLVSTRLLCSPWNTSPLKRLVFLLTQTPVYRFADSRFAEYRKIIHTTDKRYATEQELRADPPAADIYMTGSDQTWNAVTCGELDPVYFLSFLRDDEKKISYAASFGKAALSQAEKEMAAPLLKRYDAITVREGSGCEILSGMGLEGQQVLDPVLLLTAREWQELIPQRACKERYILVYQLHPNKEFERYTAAFAKQAGLKLYRISHCFHHAVRCGHFLCCPPPEEFLYYIQHADCLLTDSFHGTAFATALNTPFVNVLPKANSERIHSLLRLIGCENRLVTDYRDFSLMKREIDFQSVNERLDEERQRSLQVLEDMLKAAKGERRREHSR